MSTQRSPKRVLVVVNQPLGGIRTYLLYNASILSQSGYVFTFLAPQGAAFDAFKNDVRDWNGVEFIDVPARNFKYWLWPTIHRTIKRGDFSLVHAQGLRAGVETSFANYFAGVPQIVTLHDVIVPQNDIPGRLRWLKTRCIGRMAARANVIIPVSKDCAENHLERFPGWKRGRCRIEVIHNGVDVQRLLSAAASVTKENGLRHNGQIAEEVAILGFFGRFVPQKGFLVLLDALKLLAQRGYADKLRLVATLDRVSFSHWHPDRVEEDEVLSRMVRFIEPVSEIAPVLSQMDLLAMPSLWEAYGLLAAEAMVLGIPVVGSDAIGLREVLRGTPAFSPQAGDAPALAAAIEAAISPTTKRDCEACAPEARRRFNNHDSAIRLLKIYDEMAR